ncbi:MAG: hypothetical protein HYU66_17050 [Armatimonadetes bacterium]|nr:hypothetical protein [Armatimonadota bacterium]
MVLQADLDGGGEGGALVADDQWHQAKAPLKAMDDYAKVPHDLRLPAYVWLAPTSGWDVPHRTYVDRIEVTVGGDDPQIPRPAPESATHVRPRPGAQTGGPGWIWWEAEDAVQSNVLYGGALAPDTSNEQAILSNGAWLQWHGVPDPALDARWTVDLPEAGRYALWCRAMGETFRWRWNDGRWRPSTGGWTDERTIRGMGKYVLSVQWLCLGAVDLPAGKDTFAVTMDPDEGAVGFDCFLLTKGEFKPDGVKKP